MSTTNDVQTLYLQGYEAFDRRDFVQATDLADRSLAGSASDSYWRLGALGLKCWISNFTGDLVTVERCAQLLLESDGGENKPWFDGLALLNLGICRWQEGRLDEASRLFREASRRYGEQTLLPRQPAEWRWIIRFFSIISEWAASGRRSGLDALANELSRAQPTAEGERGYLRAAVNLLIRHAQGEDVREEARVAIKEGASRTFFAMILLTTPLP